MGYVHWSEGPCSFLRGDNYKIEKNWKSSSIETLGQFQPNLAKRIPGWKGFKFVQMERPHPFTTGDDNKVANIHSRNL